MSTECLSDRLTAAAHGLGKKKAITFLRKGKIETELSYAELLDDSNRMAQTFQRMGISKGDRVILFLPKSLALVIAHLGLLSIGAISVPLNPGFKKAEMSYFLADSEARLVLCSREQEPMIREIAPEVPRLLIAPEKPYQEIDFFRAAPAVRPAVRLGPEDPGLIIYTSGTTGNPKGAVLSQRNLVKDAENIVQIWEITEADVLCHALPLFHIHGLCFALHTCLMAGSHIVMLDAFTPGAVIEILAQGQGDLACTLFMAVPSMYAMLIENVGERRLNFEHLRLWTSGSAPLLPQDFARMKRIFGKEPLEREGMSETGMNFSNPLRGMRKPGSIGRPLPGVQVRLVDPETAQDVPPGQTGEIWLKSPSITSGYWRKPGETAKAFADGWFKTGDLARVDEDGYYFLTDRIKHIIISGGENISPQEVEGLINSLAGVIESAVVGIADERWGERVVAAVVADPGAGLDPQKVRAYCKEHLHDWKCPKEVIMVRELPRNTMGKVLKDDVKGLFPTPPTLSSADH